MVTYICMVRPVTRIVQGEGGFYRLKMLTLIRILRVIHHVHVHVFQETSQLNYIVLGFHPLLPQGGCAIEYI
jgi:hypothetical protein